MQVGWELHFVRVSLDGLQGASLICGEIEPSTQIRAQPTGTGGHSAGRAVRTSSCQPVRPTIGLLKHIHAKKKTNSCMDSGSNSA